MDKHRNQFMLYSLVNIIAFSIYHIHIQLKNYASSFQKLISFTYLKLILTKMKNHAYGTLTTIT